MGPDVATRLGLLAAAAALEAAAGYPDALYRTIGHPVTWIGALIGWLEGQLNPLAVTADASPPPSPNSTPRGGGLGWGGVRDSWRANAAGARLAGVVALTMLLIVSIAIAFALQAALAASWPGLVLLAILASTLLATRALDAHVGAVAVALETGGLEAGGLEAARQAVARIVGRDPEPLDEAGVCRAAIESLAENFSDGVIAPALWFAVAGLPGMVAYKAINTADSMIGHRTPRHEAFGWASARLDDLVNLPASRASAALLSAASCLAPAASPSSAIRAVFRDARNHRSPNAGWPEAAMAGALGLRLAGPRSYGGVLSTDPPMGDGRVNANPADIRRALVLYRLAAAIGWVVVLAAAVVR